MFTEWFPASGYEHAGGMETYPIGRDILSQDHVTLIWIPIGKAAYSAAFFMFV
ncbi:GyrI-like domain-containing protein [Bacillus xiamenensis]|uniref:GyrI-like domain-containing protein n=1 Tax=Bacillus xiamenensis TaxID=1178537 RepID=UPI002221882D|nr:GyrI-like domain-containing protein [Bacillus xiamenensis]MCW1838099.1 GyrI-like domain-containing protein [Bacillus xiamenensis]